MRGTSIGPYKLAERLGSGGMGDVYRAHDGRLGRWVAIKKIRSDREADAAQRQRLRREARAAAQLNHPSIVQVYDILEGDDNDYIVMELVEGQSLDRHVARGPLDLERVLSIGCEVADGLAEAHSKGTLHRDLKTENVIISEAGHAKILDFGLARPLPGNDIDPSLTAHDHMVGTSRTLSPEYASGDEIDHRSDLFQLGVLLYEITTGRSPFRAQNVLATLKRVILHDPDPVHEVNPEIGEELSGLIGRLLEKEPEDRPESAEEVAGEMRRIAGYSSSGALLRAEADQLPWRTLSWSNPRLRWLAAALLILLVGTSGIFYFLGRSRGAAAVLQLESTDPILFAGFDNQTGEEHLNYSLDEGFRVNLRTTRVAKLVTHEQVQEVLKRMALPEDTRLNREIGLEICRRDGFKALISGTVIRLADTYVLAADIVDPQTEAVLSTAEAKAGSSEEILAALEALTRKIRSQLGESLVNIRETTQPLAKVTTSNLKALEAYSRALSLLARQDYEQSVPLLKEAARLDPGFAMAYTRLATIYLARSPAEARLYITKAMELSERLTGFEKHYIEAWDAVTSGTPAQMKQAWSIVANLYPERQVGYENLARVLFFYENNFNEVCSALQPVAGSQDKEAMRILSILGYCQMAIGQHEAAVLSFDRARRLSGDTSFFGSMEALLLAGRPKEAAQLLQDYTVSEGPGRVTLGLHQALLESSRGDFSAATAAARESLAVASRFGMHDARLRAQLAMLAYQELSKNGDEGIHQSLENGLKIGKDLMPIDLMTRGFSLVTYLANIGKVALRHGRTDIAEAALAEIKDLEEIRDFPVREGYLAILDGEIRASQGDFEGAVERFRRAIELANLYQAHDSLSRAYEASGDLDGAIAETLWLVEHHGQGLSECVAVCFGRNLNQAAWWRARGRLSDLYRQKGDLASAEAFDASIAAANKALERIPGN